MDDIMDILLVIKTPSIYVFIITNTFEVFDISCSMNEYHMDLYSR